MLQPGNSLPIGGDEGVGLTLHRLLIGSIVAACLFLCLICIIGTTFGYLTHQRNKRTVGYRIMDRDGDASIGL